uniref:SFRICE_002988 n=1 Tax=Spodoptera frugiperda TaxID=7108 RepID=A0A2H1W3U8_SPOFR
MFTSAYPLGYQGQLAKISRVDITLIINNTSSFAFSEDGVGKSEFSGTLYLPTHLNFVIYSLTIYSCNLGKEYVTSPKTVGRDDSQHTYMPFLRDKITVN